MESQLLLLWHRDTLRREDVHSKATDGAVAGGEKRRRGEEEQRWQDVGRSIGKIGRERESATGSATKSCPSPSSSAPQLSGMQPNMGFVCMGLWATLYCREDTGDTRKMGRCDHIVCDTSFLLFTRFSSVFQHSPPISPVGLMF